MGGEAPVALGWYANASAWVRGPSVRVCTAPGPLAMPNVCSSVDVPLRAGVSGSGSRKPGAPPSASNVQGVMARSCCRRRHAVSDARVPLALSPERHLCGTTVCGRFVCTLQGDTRTCCWREDARASQAQRVSKCGPIVRVAAQLNELVESTVPVVHWHHVPLQCKRFLVHWHRPSGFEVLKM